MTLPSCIFSLCPFHGLYAFAVFDFYCLKWSSNVAFLKGDSYFRLNTESISFVLASFPVLWAMRIMSLHSGNMIDGNVGI